MRLSNILVSKLDYEGDVCIYPEYGAESVRYQVEQYQGRGYVALADGWMTSPGEVNTFLMEDQYHFIDKQADKIPFTPRWDYRFILPSWALFQSWLTTYYTDAMRREQEQAEKYTQDRAMREYGLNAAARRDVYRSLLEHITKKPVLQELVSWTWDQWKAAEEQLAGLDDANYAQSRTREYRDRKRYQEQLHYTWEHVAEVLIDYRDALMHDGREA